MDRERSNDLQRLQVKGAITHPMKWDNVNNVGKFFVSSDETGIKHRYCISVFGSFGRTIFDIIGEQKQLEGHQVVGRSVFVSGKFEIKTFLHKKTNHPLSIIDVNAIDIRVF